MTPELAVVCVLLCLALFGLGFLFRGWVDRSDANFWRDAWEHEAKHAAYLAGTLRKANDKLDRIRDVAAE